MHNYRDGWIDVCWADYKHTNKESMHIPCMTGVNIIPLHIAALA